MNKFVVAEIDADMGDGAMFTQRMEKDEIAFLEFVAADMPGKVILFFRGAGQSADTINGRQQQERKGGTVDAVARRAAVVVRSAIPVIHEAQQFRIVEVFNGTVFE